MPKKRVPPSAGFREEWDAMLTCGVDGRESLLGSLVRGAARYMLQVALEEEVAEFLGREHYGRGERKHRGYRNGYEPKRVVTAEGPIELAVPQVRDTASGYRSELLEALTKRTASFTDLVQQMYVRGMSQQDVAQAFAETFDERVLSKSTVSRVAKSLQDEFDTWRKRDLSADPVIYLFLDAIYLKARQGERGADAVFCAYGITETGRKILLHLDLGEKESHTAWLGFLQNLAERGVTQPLLVASDGAPGLRKAIREVFPRALRQRCKAHKLRNILARAPKSGQRILKEQISKVFRCEDHAEALRLARELVERYEEQWPSAIACFKDDLEECLAHLRLPPIHHRATGTTNLIERLFEEGRRRTKVVGRFPTEGSCLRLFFATLMAASRGWRGVRMSPATTLALQELRAELYGRKQEVPPTTKSSGEADNRTIAQAS